MEILNAPVPTYQTLIVRPGDLRKACWRPESWTRCVRLMWARGQRSVENAVGGDWR